MQLMLLGPEVPPGPARCSMPLRDSVGYALPAWMTRAVGVSTSLICRLRRKPRLGKMLSLVAWPARILREPRFEMAGSHAHR